MVVAFHEEHKFRELDSVSINEITKQRYIDRLHCEFRSRLISYITDNDIKLDVAFRSQREDWIQELIHQGIGVAVLPKNSLLNTAIKFKSISDEGFTRNIEFAVSLNESKSPALEKLMHLVNNYTWS